MGNCIDVVFFINRVAMGAQFKAEQDIAKHIILGMVSAICGAVVPVVVGIQTTMQDAQTAHYLSYFAIVLSLVQTVANTLAQVSSSLFPYGQLE